MTDQGQGAERLGPLARFLRNWRIARLTRAVTAAQATGEPAQVLARLLELVPLLVRQRGEDHAQTQSCINAVGLAYRSLERYDEAAIWYARAMASRDRAGDTTSADYAVVCNNIGMLRMYQGDLSAAIEHLTTALAIREQVLGANGGHTQATLFALLECLTRDYRFEDAANGLAKLPGIPEIGRAHV